MPRIKPLYLETSASGALKAPFGFPKHTSTTRDTTAKLTLGTVAYDDAGAEYRYVKAGAAIAQYDAVTFNGSASGFDDVRKTSAVNQLVLGVATAAFNSNEYGFVQTRGVATVKVVDATAAKALLASTATAGVLGIAVNTDLQGRGACALVTGVSTGSAVFFQ